METKHWRSGEGRWALEAWAVHTGGGIAVYLDGGETPHVGCSVLAEPRASLTGAGRSCTLSMLNRLGHKDDQFAQELARRLCVGTGEPVSVAAGVHVEGAGGEDLLRLQEQFYALCAQIEADFS
mgnify:FL=1